MKKSNKDIKKIADKVTSDKNQEKWEKGELGKDPKHAKVYKGLEDVEKPLPTSIRLPQSLILELKKLAKEEGVPYQTYLKMVLTRHVRDKAS